MLASDHLKQLKEQGYSQEQILTMIKRHRENTGALLADAVVAVGSDQALRDELLGGAVLARPSYQVLVERLNSLADACEKAIKALELWPETEWGYREREVYDLLSAALAMAKGE